MKSVRNRLIFLLVVLAIGAYYLYPTLKYDRLSKQERSSLMELSGLSGIPLNQLSTDIYRDDVDLSAEIQAADLPPEQKAEAIRKLEFMRGPFLEDLKYYRPKAIKLGLDLQGGMYLVLEVDLIKLLDNQAKGKDDIYARIMTDLRARVGVGDADVFDALRQLAVRERTSLSRYWGDPGQSDDAVISDLENSAEDAVDRSLEILRNRIDQFGVSEPNISKMGTRRIAIELPGVRDPVRARELVGRTALLEFKLLIEPERARDILTSMDAAIAARLKGESPADSLVASDTTQLAQADTAKTKADTSRLAADTSRPDTSTVTEAEKLFAEQMPELTDTATNRENPLLSLFVGGTSDILVPSQNRSRVMRTLAARENQKLIPADVQFLWSSKTYPSGTGGENWILYMVKRQAELTGATLQDAQATIGSGYDPQQAGRPVCNLQFNREGGRVFARVTGANVGRRLAIALDDKIYLAPNIQDKIPGGSAVITGLDDMNEARDVAIVLRAGALPAPVHVVEERTVGPSLGHDSVAAGQLSLLLAYAIVTLFMLWYYRASGGIADLAMVVNLFLLMGALALFQFTLTMPGIAGIILTIGMAVDANVLIFERIREELALGKTVRAAIEMGFSRALVTIIDANVTTAIAGVVLLIYGTGSIKGFALTLTIGIIMNLFAAVFVTRLVYDTFTARRQLNRLSI